MLLERWKAHRSQWALERTTARAAGWELFYRMRAVPASCPLDNRRILKDFVRIAMPRRGTEIKFAIARKWSINSASRIYFMIDRNAYVTLQRVRIIIDVYGYACRSKVNEVIGNKYNNVWIFWETIWFKLVRRVFVRELSRLYSVV